MDFRTILAQKRDSITRKWFQQVVETYPPATARLLIKETNQFANPVGHTIRHGIQALFDEFLQGLDEAKLTPHLDRIIRIRAIQDFSPARAVAFVFYLKSIVREALQQDLQEGRVGDADLRALDAGVDEMALIAFNIYSQCRDRLHETRIAELKGRTFRLLQKADLLGEVPEWDPKSKGTKHHNNLTL